MVDVGGKPLVRRTATATGFIRLRTGTVGAVRRGRVKKGDVAACAKVAAVLAVKNTPSIVPLCHPVPVTKVDVEVTPEEGGVSVTCTVDATYRTGVEMEALTGVAAALLTVWDMVKYLEKDRDGQYPFTGIESIRVVEKRKGG